MAEVKDLLRQGLLRDPVPYPVAAERTLRGLVKVKLQLVQEKVAKLKSQYRSQRVYVCFM